MAWFWALRDIRIRYKQTIFGVGWSVIYPIFAVGVFSLLFSMVLGKDDLPTVPGIPYAVSTLCALVPWQLFASALSASGNSLVKNEHLITKLYFPRLIAPMAPLLVSLIDFGVSFLVLSAVLAWLGIIPGIAVLLLPLFVFLALMTALAVGLWVSVVGAIFRDVTYALDRIIPLWMFLTPVLYTTPQSRDGDVGVLGWVFALNPMTSVVDGFRWALLGAQAPQLQLLSVSVAITALLLVGGLFFFRRVEKIMVDLI